MNKYIFNNIFSQRIVEIDLMLFFQKNVLRRILSPSRNLERDI